MKATRIDTIHFDAILGSSTNWEPFVFRTSNMTLVSFVFFQHLEEFTFKIQIHIHILGGGFKYFLCSPLPSPRISGT